MPKSPPHDPNAIIFAIRPSMVQRNRPFLALPVDHSLLLSVGSVVLYWGQFELIFDEHLDMLIHDAWSEDQDGKLSSQFKARKKLLVRLSKRVFGEGTAIAAYFEEIAISADELRWRRDIVAHGTWISHHPPTTETPVKFTATGVRHGKPVTLAIDLDVLDKMWHDLAHLAGNLMNCANATDARHSLSSHDRSLLQAFVSKVRPPLPKRRRFPDQPST